MEDVATTLLRSLLFFCGLKETSCLDWFTLHCSAAPDHKKPLASFILIKLLPSVHNVDPGQEEHCYKSGGGGTLAQELQPKVIWWFPKISQLRRRPLLSRSWKPKFEWPFVFVPPRLKGEQHWKLQANCWHAARASEQSGSSPLYSIFMLQYVGTWFPWFQGHPLISGAMPLESGVGFA